MSFARRGASVALATATGLLMAGGSARAFAQITSAAPKTFGTPSPEALGLEPIDPTANRVAALPYGAARERVDPDAVQSNASAFDVTEEVAIERLAIQTMVPNLTTQLADALGKTLGLFGLTIPLASGS